MRSKIYYRAYWRYLWRHPVQFLQPDREEDISKERFLVGIVILSISLYDLFYSKQLVRGLGGLIIVICQIEVRIRTSRGARLADEVASMALQRAKTYESVDLREAAADDENCNYE